MVRVNSSGFLQFLAARREPRPSLQEWVESELEAFTVFLAERLVNFTNRSELIQSRTSRFGPAEGEGKRHPAEMISGRSESEGTNSCCYPCGAT